MNVNKVITDQFLEVLNGIYEEKAIRQLARMYYEDKELGNDLKEESFLRIIRADLQRIKSGDPIQYVTGKSYFYDRIFNVNKHVLIPRPETEELILLILNAHKNDQNLEVLDIGTGTGCIPIILKDFLKNSRIYSVDISVEAIDVAKSNATKYDLDIEFLNMDFLNEVNWVNIPTLDLIVSNPPYIREEETEIMSDSVLKYEPLNALIPNDKDPLIFYKKIARLGRLRLKSNGRIYVEINEFLSRETSEVFKNSGYKVEIHKDLQGKDRMIVASFSN